MYKRQLKAGAQALFQALDLLGRAVRCDDDLLVGIVEGVEGVEEFFLGGLDVYKRQVLEGILLKAEGFQLTLTGYDLEMGIVTTIEANVKEPRCV